MAANPTVGAEAGTGAEGSPSQPVSPQAQTPIESDVTKLLAGLGERFDGLQRELRGLQGRQDKAENNFQQQLARLESYEKQGLTREQAIAEMQSDDAAEMRWTNLEKKLDDLAARFAGAGTQANAQQKVAQVFESIGLDVKDPRVASSLLKQYKDADAVELEAYRLLHQIQQSPNPNPAQQSSLSGGNAGGNNQPNPLAVELNELMANPTQNWRRISEIKGQLDKEGWK